MRLAVFDTETTGLPLHPAAPLNKQPKIIEFAARVCTEKGSTDEQLTFLCNPGEKLEPIITKITGLTDDDLKSEKPFEAHLDEVQKFLDGCDGICAHNLPFDMQLVWFSVLRASRQKTWRWPKQLVCTVQMFQPRYGRRPKLTTLYEDLTGSKYPQTHRALDDVDALVEIVNHGEVFETLSSFKDKVGIYIPPDVRAD